MPFKGMQFLRNGPITATEFFDALGSIWRPPWRARTVLGLAVSGGMDSMALATLCQSLPVSYINKTNLRFTYQAFVVDHRARDGSDREAALVASKLQDMGLPAKVLHLQWPSGVEPETLPDFESQARRLRYRALGKACCDYGIDSLLLAHHEDDQAETVLMRLAKGHRDLGLQGMRPEVGIPECWGVHGVSQSGDLDRAKGKKNRKRRKLGSKKQVINPPLELERGGIRVYRPLQHFSRERLEDNCKKQVINPPLELERGGIRVYRPLQHFSKDRLEATCKWHDTPWFEDASNSDPTLTLRNTVRYLLRTGKLPRALRKESLLTLAKIMKHKSVDRNSRGKNLFQSCTILKFDTRSGMLVVRTPLYALPSSRPSPAEHEEHKERRLIEAQYKAANFLRCLIEIVTPQEAVPLQILRFGVDTLFPELSDPEVARTGKKAAPSAFTVANVHFEPLRSPLPGADAVKEKYKRLDHDYIWVLSRQPYHLTVEDPNILIAASRTLKLPSSIKHSQALGGSLILQDPPSWHLYDGRFWIRISNLLPYKVRVRPFYDTELTALRTALPEPERRRLKALLREAAPGKVRWTLPAVVVLLAGEERPVGLPNLDVGLVEFVGPGKVEWEVRYKRVNLELGRETEAVE